MLQSKLRCCICCNGVYLCGKGLLPMFHLCFLGTRCNCVYLDVAYISHIRCMCVFRCFFKCFSSMFQVFHMSLHCNCWIWMFQKQILGVSSFLTFCCIILVCLLLNIGGAFIDAAAGSFWIGGVARPISSCHLDGLDIVWSAWDGVQRTVRRDVQTQILPKI
jgi:hypothetical protein